jgi:hypothetical protein
MPAINGRQDDRKCLWTKELLAANDLAGGCPDYVVETGVSDSRRAP